MRNIPQLGRHLLLSALLLCFGLALSHTAHAQKAKLPKLPGTKWVIQDVRYVDASGAVMPSDDIESAAVLESFRAMLDGAEIAIVFQKKGQCLLMENTKPHAGTYKPKGLTVEIVETGKDRLEIATYDPTLNALLLNIDDKNDSEPILQAIFVKVK